MAKKIDEQAEVAERVLDAWATGAAGPGSEIPALGTTADPGAIAGLDWCGPLESVVALQVLARELAVALGRDVDKPRNLAKSVTVE